MTRARTSLISAALIGAAWALSACDGGLHLGGDGGGQTSTTGGGAAGGGGGSAGSGGTPATSTAASSGAGGNIAGCLVDPTVIFTLDWDGFLSRFDPQARTFTEVGTVTCLISVHPEAMVVDRSGHAWVRATDDKIYDVDVTTKACTPTSYVPGQHGFTGFGMGIATNGPDSAQETVYLANYNGKGLGKLDLATLHVTPVGSYDHIQAEADLAGTGDGRLFALFAQYPAMKVGELDPTNAHVISLTPLTGVDMGAGSMVAAWGGSLYVFTEHGLITTVWKYDPGSGTAQVIAHSNEHSISAASASTCAPASAPP